MEHLDNAPARLARLMAALSSSGKAGECLGVVLAGPGEQSLPLEEVARRLAHAFPLTDEVEAVVLRDLPLEDPQRVTAVVRDCRQLLTNALWAFGSRPDNLGQLEMHDLQQWAAKLERTGKPQVQTDSLRQLRDLLDEATATLDNADDLDDDLAAFLREIVAVLARAVQDAMIRGPKAVDDALVHIAGLLRRHTDTEVKARRHSGPAVKKVIAAVLAAAALVTPYADNALSITASVATLTSPSEPTIVSQAGTGPQTTVVVLAPECPDPGGLVSPSPSHHG